MTAGASTGTDRAQMLNRLSGESFDVLIIGAGIYGATLACRAARAGLTVALIDKGDFGGAASANSLKILHGGLRYLQQLDFPRMRESIAARRDGLSALPHLARPATFLAPARGSLKRSRTAFRAAALLNDLVSHDRNRGAPASHHLSPTRVLGSEAFHALPGMASVAADGALQWSDGFIENTERFTLAYVMTARHLGAATANYVEAIRLRQTNRAVEGVLARDAETGREFDIRAKITVNAAGGWLSGLLPEGIASEQPSAWVRAWNIVVNRAWFGSYGIGLDNRARNFFFAPWRGGTIIGTAYDVFTQPADACRLTPSDLATFVQHVNELYPPAALRVEDVTMTHLGVMPAKVDAKGVAKAEPSGQTRLIDYAATDGVSGFLALLGVKYTTGSFWAERSTSLILQRLGHIDGRLTGPLYGAESVITPDTLARQATATGWNLSPETARWLADSYGSRGAEVLALGAESSAARALIPGTPVPLAAIVHAVRHEQAVHLTDVILRRTDLGSFASPASEARRVIADIMKDLHNWSEDRRDREIADLREHYVRLGLPIES